MVAIFAEDPYVAEDAADLIELDANQLPVISDADQDQGDEVWGQEAALDSYFWGCFIRLGISI